MDDRHPHLRVLPSVTVGSPTSVDQIEVCVRVEEPEPRPGGITRRRYTVTVQPDGSELVDDVEEWIE